MRTFIFLSLIIMACNSNQEAANTAGQPETSKKSGDSTISSSQENCYWQIMKRDTLVAALKQDGEFISGKLTFDNYEKDGSSGTVTGKVDGEIIKLWYSFQSEGMHSVMEVWYQKQGDALVRGVGESAVKGDTSYFTNPASVTFDANQRLEKVHCNDLPEKYN